MKRIKISLALASMLLSIPIASINAGDTLQIQVRDSGKWQLIGVNGLHIENGDASSNAGDTWSLITGVSNGNVMDTVDNNSSFTYYNFTASGATGNAVETTDDNASIGVKIIINELLPNDEATTIGDEVYLKGSFKVYEETSPKNSMYIKSKAEYDPVVRLIYQSNMEDTTVFLKFDNNDDSNYYIIKLDSSRTYDNALVLEGLEYNQVQDTTTNTDANITAKVVDVYDENLSDNNRSKFPNDKFLVAEEVTQKNADTNITLYKFDNNTWLIYDSRSDGDTIKNDFESFEVGKGYWAKVEQKDPTTPAGFIFATNGITNENWTSVFGNLINGWNLLSFNDDILRFSPAGIFIDINDLSSGITIKDAYGSNSFTVPDSACDTENNASAYINFKVEQTNQKGIANFKMRAFPATKGSTDGIVILSANRFEVNTTAAISIAGNTVIPDPINDFYYPPYGEYVMGLQPNESIYDLDAPIAVTLQSYDSSLQTETVDLNNTANINEYANAIKTKLDVLKDNNASVYTIDVDWDGNKDTILMATDKKFGIKEASYYKLYKMGDNGTSVYVEGNVSGADAAVVSVTTFSQTVADINNTYNTTGVKAFESNSTEQTMLLISKNAGVDIKEGNEKGVLKDLMLNHNDGNNTKKGAAIEVYDNSNFASIDVKYNNDDNYVYAEGIGQPSNVLSSLINDLEHQTVWVRDFPDNRGAIQKLAQYSGKRVKQILTAGRTDNGVRWLSLDATKSPAEWFDPDDTQTLMWTEKERGYWVLLEDYIAPTITQTVGEVIGTSVTTHFDNNISNDGTSVTKNYVRKTIPITIDGINNSEYTYASINGISYPLINNGGSRLLYIDSYAMKIAQGSSDKSITLYTYDGLGGVAKTDNAATVGVVQPSAPVIGWSETDGSLTISNTDFAHWEIHENNISDIDPSSSIKATVTDISYNMSNLQMGWSGINNAKPYYDMKVVTVGTNGFYSNIQGFKYAPVHEGTHVLSSSDTNYDKAPGTYITDPNAPAIKGDTGVQIKSLTGNTVTIAYIPQKNDDEYAQFDNSLPTTMFVEANSTHPIGVLKFQTSAYNGEKFYIYDASSKSLYYGIFNMGYGNDDARYTLTKVDNYGLDGQIIIKP